MAKKKVGSQIVKLDSQPLKIKNHLDFLACRWLATYCWKALHKGYNFTLNLISIGGFHTKLCAPKIMRDSTLRISRLPLVKSKTKWHLGAGHVARKNIYYKGEGGGFPQVWVMVSLMSLCLPMAHPNTKNIQITH
jgi:hypothetical protein